MFRPILCSELSTSLSPSGITKLSQIQHVKNQIYVPSLPKPGPLVGSFQVDWFHPFFLLHKHETSVILNTYLSTLVSVTKKFSFLFSSILGYPVVCVCAVLSHFSCTWLFATLWTRACQAPPSRDSPGKNTGVGCHAPLQEIFPIQGSYPCLLCLQCWQAGSLSQAPPEKSFPKHLLWWRRHL